MSSRRKPALLLVVVCALAGCGLAPPATPPPFHCEDYDAAAERFPASCAEDAGEEEDLGGDEDAGDVDGGP